MHLNVSDIAAWYAERHPDARLGDLVPEICPFCFAEIKVGDAIVTRRFLNDCMEIQPNQHGIIKAILTNPEYGNLYIVTLESENELTCLRAAIRKPYARDFPQKNQAK